MFGTPDNPLGFEDDIGVPFKSRLTNDNGTAFTTTAGPTPHSDRNASITGSFGATLKDNTPVDSPTSRDTVEGEFTFTDPKGANEYRVVLRKRIPMGPVHQFFGGVLIDGFLRGKTAFGTRMQPTVYNYGAVWAVADLYVNGEKVSDNRMVHMMTTERVRSSDADGYRLRIDSELTRKGIQTHLLLPNIAGGSKAQARSHGIRFTQRQRAAVPPHHVRRHGIGGIAGPTVTVNVAEMA